MLEAATKLPFDQGCARERELFIDCLFSEESSALIHAFFGEREVAKAAIVSADVAARTVSPALGRYVLAAIEGVLLRAQVFGTIDIWRVPATMHDATRRDVIRHLEGKPPRQLPS